MKSIVFILICILFSGCSESPSYTVDKSDCTRQYTWRIKEYWEQGACLSFTANGFCVLYDQYHRVDNEVEINCKFYKWE